MLHYLCSYVHNINLQAVPNATICPAFALQGACANFGRCVLLHNVNENAGARDPPMVCGDFKALATSRVSAQPMFGQALPGVGMSPMMSFNGVMPNPFERMAQVQANVYQDRGTPPNQVCISRYSSIPNIYEYYINLASPSA
jgi:hypothetical protein